MLRLQLQRFAGEKTERATPKRREEARKEGNVAKSPELTSAFVLLALVVVLRFTAPLVWGRWVDIIQRDFTMPLPTNWTTTTVTEVLTTQVVYAGEALVPFLGTALVIGLAVAVAQVRPMFVPALLTPKFSRIQPLEGLKRMFSTRSLVELAKSLLKLTIVGAIAYSLIQSMLGQIQTFTELDVGQIPGAVGAMVFSLGVRIAAMMVVLAFFDFLYQRYEYERNLKMSKQDVKDEMKQMEGSPEVKASIRKRARQIAFRRMMEEVPKADVVITNPTHYAIALKYDNQTMNAPEVIAKGADLLAQRLKAKASESGVPMVENRPLAQGLYRLAEVGDPVPAELYQAVAEVLAYVYRMKAQMRR